MGDILKFIKSTGIYLLGNVLSKAMAFLLIPLYTKYLDPSDYGIYDLHLAYVTFLSSILFLDIWGGIMRFMFDYKNESDKGKPITCGLIIFLCSTVVYAIGVFVIGTSMRIPHKMLLFLYGLFLNIQTLTGFITRALGKNVTFAIAGILGTMLNLGTSILFIAYMHKGYEYIYVANIIGFAANSLFLIYNTNLITYINISNVSKKLLKSMLKFAAPLSINSVAYWFLSSYNKVIVTNSLSSFDNGLYAVATKFSNLLNLVTQCFQMAWQELTFSKAGTSQKEMDVFYTKAVNEYIKFVALGGMVLIAVIKVIFPFMVDSSYSLAENIVPFAIISALMSCLSSFFGSIISTIKKNKYIFTTTALGSIVNVALIQLTISPLKVQAASISLAAGFLAIVIRRIFYIKRYINVKILYKQLLLIVLGYIIVSMFYFYMNIIINAVMVLALCCIYIFIYRDKFKNIIKKVK